MRFHISDPATKAGREPFLSNPAGTPETVVSVLSLLVDAEAALAADKRSASASLARAIAVLRRAGDRPAETIGTRSGCLARWQIQRITTYIDEHLDTTVRTGDLAVLLGLSVSHFSHSFKQTVGIPPLAYVARRRIEAARAMMLRTNEPLTRIAHLYGFCDQSHFSRTFRRETGMAPQAWRRCHTA